MNKFEISTGVHTYSVGMPLTAKQYYQIQKSLSDHLRLTNSNFWAKKEQYTVDFLKESGIVLYLSKIKRIYRIKVRLEPCRVLGNSDPAALYQPSKKSYREMIQQVDKLLQPYHIPCSIDEMKISRIDLTCNLLFSQSDPVQIYIRSLQKAFVLPHFKRDYFRPDDGKAKNPQEANRHSCKQKCRSASFFSYDKTAQLQMIGRLTNELIGKRVLRLEAELKREAMKKHLGKQPDNYHYLKAGAAQAQKVIKWYLKRLFKHADGTHMCYCEAVELVQQQTWKPKTRERALYLLRKVSDSQSLDAALQKTMAHFGIKRDAADRLLCKLRKAGINPITLPNSSHAQPIESMLKYFK